MLAELPEKTLPYSRYEWKEILQRVHCLWKTQSSFIVGRANMVYLVVLHTVLDVDEADYFELPG